MLHHEPTFWAMAPFIWGFSVPRNDVRLYFNSDQTDLRMEARFVICRSIPWESCSISRSSKRPYLHWNANGFGAILSRSHP